MLPLLAVIGWLSIRRRRTVPSVVHMPSVVPTPELVVRFSVAPRAVIEPTTKRASTDEYVAEALAATSTVVPTRHAVPSAIAVTEESKPIQVIIDPPSQPIEPAPRRVARGSAAPLFELDDEEITNIVPRPFTGDTTERSILLL